MTSYNRNITSKLLFRRVLLILLVIVIIDLYNRNLADYFIIISVTVLAISFFPVTKLSVSYDAITIKKYYLFGVIPLSRRFQIKDVVGFYPVSILLESDDNAYMVDSETALDIIVTFLPTPKVRIEQFVFKYKNSKGEEIKVTESLTKEEYDLMITLFKKRT